MLASEYEPYRLRPAHAEGCTELPSSCACSNVDSLWAITSSPQAIDDPGKWMVFPPTLRDADRAWILIRAVTGAGGLGFAAKVSLKSRVKPAILVFCSGSGVEKDRVRQRLWNLVEGLWSNVRLVWKSDAQTYVEPVYSPGYAVLQRSPGSSGLFNWFNAIRLLLDVERAHLLPPEHEHGSPGAIVAALMGDALLKLAVLRALSADALELYASRQADPEELTTRTAFAVSNELLGREAVTILVDGLADTDLIGVPDLDRLSEHGRATVVEAAVYHVNRLLLERESTRATSSAAPAAGSPTSAFVTAQLALEDLAQHLVAAAGYAVDWRGLLLRTGGTVSVDASGAPFLAVASLHGLDVQGPPMPSKQKAAAAAAKDLLMRIGHPFMPVDRVPGFASFVAKVGKVRGLGDDAVASVEFRGVLEQAGGELTPATQTPDSTPQRPLFVAVASVAGVTRSGTAMSTMTRANGAAAVAALCAAGLVTPKHAALALAGLFRTGGGATGSNSDVSSASAAPLLPPLLCFGDRQVESAKFRVDGSIHSAYDFKGLVLSLGGIVHRAIPVEGAAQHEPQFCARASMGTDETMGAPQSSMKRAEAAAAEALLRRVFLDTREA